MNERRLFWQLPLVILFTSPLWHGAVAHFLTIDPQSSWQAPLHQDSNFMMEGVDFSQIKQGVPDLRLRGLRLHGAGEGQGFDLEEATAQRLGPSPARITSGHAHYDPEKEILTMQDDVVLQTADLVIRTMAMRYLAKFETVKSAADVEMVGHGFNITGTTFMYNLATGNLRIGERVRFLYTPPPTPPTTNHP